MHARDASPTTGAAADKRSNFWANYWHFAKHFRLRISDGLNEHRGIMRSSADAAGVALSSAYVRSMSIVPYLVTIYYARLLIYDCASRRTDETLSFLITFACTIMHGLCHDALQVPIIALQFIKIRCVLFFSFYTY